MNEVFLEALWTTFLAGLVTGLGGFLIFAKKKYTQDNINFMLSIAAGIMLAAAFFALLVPSQQQIVSMISDIHVAGFWYVGAVFAGVALIWILNSVLPHEHSNLGHHGFGVSKRTAWLFIIAITIHKIPEGLAMGIAYGAQNLVNPDSLTVGIAMHNVPEGLTIALSLVAVRYSRLKAALCATMVGMIQPLGALLGVLLIHADEKVVPLGMAMAGGTLLFVVVNEILPETYDVKKSNRSAFAVFAGFIFMTYLTIVLH